MVCAQAWINVSIPRVTIFLTVCLCMPVALHLWKASLGPLYCFTPSAESQRYPCTSKYHPWDLKGMAELQHCLPLSLDKWVKLIIMWLIIHMQYINHFCPEKFFYIFTFQDFPQGIKSPMGTWHKCLCCSWSLRELIFLIYYLLLLHGPCFQASKASLT